MFWQFTINGLITGVLYSLMAIGFALIYNTTRIFHIAAAGIYVFAAYMLWLFSSSCGLPIIVAALLSLILSAGLSLAMEIVVYRPLMNRKASSNVALIASIGMMTIVVSTITLLFGIEAKTIQHSLPLEAMQLGSFSVTYPQVLQFICGIFIIIVFFMVLHFTNWGVRLRALTNDEQLYETLGNNLNGARSLLFLFSGAIISIASMLTRFDVGMDTTMGMEALIYAMIAIVLGGFGRYWTCVLGGIIIGIVQSLLDKFVVDSTWTDAVIFIILIMLLYIRPQGIAGYKQRSI